MKQPGTHVAYVCADFGVPVGGHKGASLHVGEFAAALEAEGARVSMLAARVQVEKPCMEPVRKPLAVGTKSWIRTAHRGLLDGAGGGVPDDPLRRAGAAETRGVLANQAFHESLRTLHKTDPVDLVYERYSLWNHAGLTFAKRKKIPFFLEVNAPLVDEQKKYRRLCNEALARDVARYVLSGADRVLVPAAELIPGLVENGVDPRRITVIPNAADPRRFGPARVLSRDTFTLGFLGSLKPWHGLDLLADVFERLYRASPSYRLLLVGDGPLREELRARFDAAGLTEAVEFAGGVGHEDVPRQLARMDCAMVPYPALPGFYFSPIKLFEYMAAGLPVVASGIGQISEVVEDGVSGVLVAPGSVPRMVRAVRALRRDPDYRLALGRAARARVLRRYTWPRNARRVLKLLARYSAEFRS